MMRWIAVVIVAGIFIGSGCSSKIGDSCSSNSDCGANRICDRSQPGGYCTTSPCERNVCPTEAICIVFENTESYCMKRCSSDSDCRRDYECVKGFGDGPFCNQIP